MKIIPLITEFTNSFNETFSKNINPLNLESAIKNVGDTFTLKLYEQFLNYIDDKFKKSKERKKIYNIKETRKRALITSIGCITVNSTSYVHKKTLERFVLLREILFLKPYQRLTNEAEYQLVKYAMDENMSQAARHALRNTIISRSTVSKKISKLNSSIKENVLRVQNQPDVLYIEMDEIHANLQHGGNKVCPCAIIHEGYEEDFVKRKKLKNIHYFASSKLKYEELWEVVFDYAYKKYDIDKFKTIFISGDGAAGIKNYSNCFPNAKFVLDPFHYLKKHLNYIFKSDIKLRNIADEYLKNNLITDFKLLVQSQIEKYPDQEKYMTEHMDYIINNIEGIQNQKDSLYKCHCSMEGHVNQGFARYITSSPYGFSHQGLENKLKLLVYHANKHDLTIEDFYNLKYGVNEYKKINSDIKTLTSIKYDQKLSTNLSANHDIVVPSPIFDSPELNNRFKELTSFRQELYII